MKRIIIIATIVLVMLVTIFLATGKYIKFDLFRQDKNICTVVVSEEVYDKQEPEKYTIHAVIPVLDNLVNDNITQSINKEIRKEIEGYIAQIENADYDNLYEKSESQLGLYPRIISNEKCYFSLLIEGSIYTGGMHPGRIYNTYNINVETGTQLTISSLFKPNTDYAIMLEKIMKDIVMKDSVYLYYNVMPKITIEKDKDFYLSNEALCIFYRPYEIAPYSEGIIEFKIPFEEIKDILIDDIRN